MKTIACLATSGLVLLSVLIAVTGVGASEDGEQPDLVAYNCREFVAYPDVAYKAADDLVPENYTVVHDRLDPNEDVPGFGTLEDPTADTAKLFIASRHCERLEAFGKTDTDLIESYIAVPIKPPASRPRPSGVRPSGSSIEYPQPLENYLVQWVTNSELRVRWLREAAGFGPDKVIVSDDIAFVYDASSSAPVQSLSVRVPSPASSPYHIEAKVAEPGGMPWEAQQNQWWDGNAGTAMIFADAPHFVLAAGEGTIVSDDLESPLGRAFGEDQTRPTGFDADKGVLVDPAAFNFYPYGEWTKHVVR